jgi:hypothetical protein
MLPRLLLVVGLTISVMLPLIWAAFAPVPGFREASEPAADPAHSGSAGADWRGAPTPEAAAPANSTAGSNEATIGTAPVSEGEASAARSDDLPRAGVSEPTLIKPNLPQANDKKAAPETLLSEEAKPLPEEAKSPPKEATTPTVSEREALAARSDDLPRVGVSDPTLIKPSLPQANDKEAAPEPLLPEEAKPPPKEATTPTASEGEASAARSDDPPRAGVSEPTLIKPSLPQANDKEAAPETLLPEQAKPPPKEATTPTVSEEEASAARSDDLSGAGVSEPTLIKPSLPQAYDKEAAPEPLVSEKAKSPPKEATTPTVNVEKLPEVKEPPSAPGASHNSRSRARADGTGSRQKMHRKKQRYRSGWVDIMREAGWLAPGRRR